jgi:hypothetical protein
MLMDRNEKGGKPDIERLLEGNRRPKGGEQ